MQWHPSRDDFKAVAGDGIPIGSFAQFLKHIEIQPKGSIRKIIIISHGSDDGVFAFGDKIREENGHCILNTKTALTEAVINKNEWIYKESSQKNGTTYEESLGLIARKLRDRFKPNGAEIVFLMCNTGNGGINRNLLQDVANAFQVVSKGFSQEILFCVQWDLRKGSRIERGFTSLPSLGGCDKKMLGLSHLKPDTEAKPKPNPGPAPLDP